MMYYSANISNYKRRCFDCSQAAKTTLFNSPKSCYDREAGSVIFGTPGRVFYVINEGQFDMILPGLTGSGVILGGCA